ncbi:unnamed protein product, partial [Brassica oleracea var. botrytis]
AKTPTRLLNISRQFMEFKKLQRNINPCDMDARSELNGYRS